MNLADPMVAAALTWLCIGVYAVAMYYWAVVPQYERNLVAGTDP
jgi:hypothetical protein